MSIARRLCADTIRDFARYMADGNTRHPALEAAERYIRGEGLPEARQVANTHGSAVHGHRDTN